MLLRNLNTIVSPQVDAEGDIEVIKEWIQKVLGAVPPVLEPTDVFKEPTMEVIAYFQTPDHEKEDAEEETVEDILTSDSLIDQISSSKSFVTKGYRQCK